MNHYSWSDLTPQDLKQLTTEQPILILGPREISGERIRQLSRQLLSNTDKKLIWGCIEEEYIAGLENSLPFKALSLAPLTSALKQLKYRSGKIKHSDGEQIKTLLYPQAEAPRLIQQGNWAAVIGINGSWHRAFHYRAEFRQLKKRQLPYKLVSSFVDKTEALSYLEQIKKNMPAIEPARKQQYAESELMQLATLESRLSFDYTFQTAAVLAKKQRFVLSAHNQVVPYETYMLHQGASKEKHLTPPQDLQYCDTNHAEVELVLKALRRGVKLDSACLYINLLPCPNCARMLARTNLQAVVYQHDHSAGYGKKMLEQAGITVKKIN